MTKDTASSRISIFRTEALRSYVKRAEKPVFPRFISPRVFSLLWILIAPVLGSAVLAWFAKVPVYSQTVAVVVDGTRVHQWASAQPLMILFLPPAELRRLKVGQRVFLKLDETGEITNRQITAVNSEVISPESAQSTFDLGAAALSRISGPKAVALTRLEPVPDGMSADSYVGSSYEGWVEVGSLRIASMFRFLAGVSNRK